MTLISALENIAEGLKKNEIPFCLAGGFAYSIYAEPRTTVDIDVVTLTSGTPCKLRETFNALFPSVYENTIVFSYKLITIQRFLLMAEDEEFVFDQLCYKPEFDEYSSAVFSRLKTIPFGETEIPVISREDLIILKSASKRKQDRLDVSNLLTDADMAYLKLWAGRLGINIET